MSVTSTSYGYYVTPTGDADNEQVITTNRIRVRNFVFIPGSNNCVCGMTDNATASNRTEITLSNTSFETWTAGDNADPDDWVRSAIAGGTATIAKESTIIQDGSYSARLTCSDVTGAFALLSQTLSDLYIGKVLYAVGYAYGTAASKAYIGFGETYSGGSKYLSKANVTASAWGIIKCAYVTGLATVPTGLKINCSVPKATSSYFDNMKLYSGNLVYKMRGPVAGTSYVHNFGKNGTVFDGLRVIFDNSSDELYIHVR